jgi:hypothetical protein
VNYCYTVQIFLHMIYDLFLSENLLLTFCSGKSNQNLRRPSHEQLEDDVWLASLKKASDAGALTAVSWSASMAFQSALAIAVVITLAVFEHPLFSLL